MNRADLIVSIMLWVSLAFMVLAVAATIVGNAAHVAAFGSASCYIALLSVYLEVYSHRG